MSGPSVSSLLAPGNRQGRFRRRFPGIPLQYLDCRSIRASTICQSGGVFVTVPWRFPRAALKVLGTAGRRFESCCPDHHPSPISRRIEWFRLVDCRWLRQACCASATSVATPTQSLPRRRRLRSLRHRSPNASIIPRPLVPPPTQFSRVPKQVRRQGADANLSRSTPCQQGRQSERRP